MARAEKYVARIYFEREDGDCGFMDSKPLSESAARCVMHDFAVPPNQKTVVAVDGNYVAVFNARNKRAPLPYGHLAMTWTEFVAPKMAVAAPLARPVAAVRKAA